MDTFARILQIASKEMLELWRHAGAMALVLSLPAIEVIVLGYATAGRIENLPTALYDADRTAASRRLAEMIHQSPNFELTYMVENLDQAEAMLEQGKVSLFFVVPHEFESALVNRNDTTALAAVIDGSNAVVANHTVIYAEEVSGRYITRRMGGPNLRPQEDERQGHISVEPRIWYNESLRRENFYIPGLLGTMLSLVVLAITAVSIVRERERGTLEQLMVSPTRPLELIIGKLIPIVAIAYVELGVMLAIAVGIFSVPVRGSLALYAGLMFVYLLAEMGMGILISTLARNQAQALPSIFLLVTVYGILGGFITPVDTMPRAAQWASALIPLSYFVTITRELFAKGAGFWILAPQLAPLLAMSLALFTASVLILRQRLV